ncbi:MAG: tetratricopeptide repeat protein [Rhodothermales bacterium]
MTYNTINTHARKISSIALSGIIALFFITSGCTDDAKERQTESRIERHQPVNPPVTVTSTPANTTPTLPTIQPKEAVLEVEGAETKVVTYAEAEAAFTGKNYVEAVDLFSSYTAQKANNPWGFYMLGLSAYRAGDYETAKTAYEEALALDQGHVKSWINLGRAQLAGGETEDAIASLNNALLIDTESADAFRLKGRAFHNLNQNAEAIASYKQALILSDSDAWSMNNLALIYIEEQQFDQALPVLALAVEINDQEALFLNNLGMVLEHHGQVQTAIETYKKAVETDAWNQKAQDNLSRLENVREKIGVAPIDLSVMANNFRDEIAAWQSFEVKTEVEVDATTEEMIEEVKGDIREDVLEDGC